MHKRTDIRDSVTKAIISMLEEAHRTGGTFPWCRPGVAHSKPANVISKQRYRGINHITLWAAGQAKNYRSGVWATYKQWQDIGAQVRKGESSSPIVVYKPLEVASDTPRQGATAPDTADGDTKIVRMVKGYHVFNADQVDGYALPDMPTVDLTARLAHVEAFVAHTGIAVAHGGARAYYRPSDDIVTMPDRVLFRDTETSTATEGYYGVLLHEIGHATGHDNRLSRDLSGRFGSQSYAMEECVAEWIAAMASAELGITPQPRADHAHYIKNWLTVLKNDNGAALAAAAQANKALDFLWSLQPDASQRAA